jgi:hypothetical protein
MVRDGAFAPPHHEGPAFFSRNDGSVACAALLPPRAKHQFNHSLT